MSMTQLREPAAQGAAKVRKYRGYFIVPVPNGYEVWSPKGVRKGAHKNVTQCRRWIARRRAG